MDIPSVKDIVKGNYAYFDRFRAGVFYYRVKVNGTTYEFPVHLGDGSEGKRMDITKYTLLSRDKAIFFMRNINRAIRMGEFVTVPSGTYGIVMDIKVTSGNAKAARQKLTPTPPRWPSGSFPCPGRTAIPSGCRCRRWCDSRQRASYFWRDGFLQEENAHHASHRPIFSGNLSGRP